jgi:hypothetical protein
LQIFTLPVAIAAISAIGLVLALTGDGWRDAVSWTGLAIPLIAAGWAMRARRS